MAGFYHQTGNDFGDTVSAESGEETATLRLADDDGEQSAVLNRSDLTAIIAGLTAIRDAMPEGE
jgi:hypothetical protein